MTYKEIIKNLADGKHIGITQPTDQLPSAFQFFEALNEIDPTYFENASERFEHNGQHLYFLEAFGRFYAKDEDGEEMRFSSKYMLEIHCERVANELEQEIASRHELENEIDNDLLTK